MSHRILTDPCLDDGVAISRRFDTTLRANDATPTPDVFYRHRLLQDARQWLSHHSPHHVARPAGRERHQYFDGFAGVIALSQRWARCEHRRYQNRSTLRNGNQG